jgi:hypothetical protein
MDKSQSKYDLSQSLIVHEQSLDNLLKIVAYLAHFSLRPDVEAPLSQREHEILHNPNLFDKIMKENYSFNKYKSLKRLIAFSGMNNNFFCTVMVINCLKNLSYCLDSCISYLEVLSEIALIPQSDQELMWELIFGFPNVFYETDFHRVMKYGFQASRSLVKMSMNYTTSLRFSSSIPSFLRSLVEASDKNESTCIIMIVFLLQMVNGNKKLFERLVRFPSPYHIYENLYDWIFQFVKVYWDRDRRDNVFSNPYSTYKQCKMFNPKLKDELIIFEENIIK